MIVTTAWIEKKYNEFNNLYWGGKLPNIEFKVGRAKKSWGFASYKYDYVNDTIIPEAITISNYYDSPENVKIQTLLHEMIHIADYTFHPERYLKNGRRISKRTYDPHGWWFLTEAKRITLESGYQINNKVTSEEMHVSKFSDKTNKCQKAKRENALICAVFGTNGIWWFKTDRFKVTYLKKNLRYAYDWRLTIGEFKTIKFYTFENDVLASYRSCGARIRGWKVDKMTFINKMKSFKATEVHF